MCNILRTIGTESEKTPHVQLSTLNTLSTGTTTGQAVTRTLTLYVSRYRTHL